MKRRFKDRFWWIKLSIHHYVKRRFVKIVVSLEGVSIWEVRVAPVFVNSVTSICDVILQLRVVCDGGVRLGSEI